jgi:hypothetical protein
MAAARSAILADAGGPQFLSSTLPITGDAHVKG